MNRHATCSISSFTRKRSSLTNKIVSKPAPLANKIVSKPVPLANKIVSKPPLKKDDDKKFIERLERVERNFEAINITLGDVKEDLKDTQVLLENANVKISELEAEIKKLKADGKPPELEHKHENVRIEETVEIKDSDPAQIVVQHKHVDKTAEIENCYAGRMVLHNAFVKLPYDSIDDIKIFTTELRDAKINDHLKNRLICIGGDGVTDCITGVLNAIMTPNLQAHISLTGKGTKKVSLLSEFKEVSTLIHDVVRASNSDYKDKNGNDIIGKLLRSRHRPNDGHN